MYDLESSLSNAPVWLQVGLAGALAVLIGLALHAVLYRLVRRLASGFIFGRNLVNYGRRPTQLLLPLLLLHIALSEVPVNIYLINSLRQFLSIGLLATLTFLCIRLIKAVAETVIALHPAEAADNLRARSVHTQTRVLARSVMLFVGLIGLASILMTFPDIRQIGASLLASAGLAGLVAGIAARPVLGNLIAGLQIALTQPLRIDDVLIVDGEWGRVEEITGSYIVISIWDQRRLIVPLQWFIEHPFQNWTRSSSQLIGTVLLWVDYAMPLAPLRQELERVCHGAPEWDGRLCLLQVTETTDKAMQLRILVSGSDASKTWDLRCRVREALLAFIQNDYADYLPRLRGSLENIGVRAAKIGVPEFMEGS